MDITQSFYDGLASQYEKLFQDWDSTTREQAAILDGLFAECGLDRHARVLDCACGIGTQTIGLAGLGYDVTASDVSEAELAEAKARAVERGLSIRFEYADFCALSNVFDEEFDIVIAMDNALPHMLTRSDLGLAVRSIASRVRRGGIFVASIRDYDRLLKDRPQYSPPYIYEAAGGRRVCFQTWAWEGENYHLVQYIIEDGEELRASKFECEYRATRRQELTDLLLASGCCEVCWKMPGETGFYQPIVVAGK